jgi:hypothetical protein
MMTCAQTTILFPHRVTLTEHKWVTLGERRGIGAADSEVQSTFQRYSAGREITGVATLIEFIDKKVIDVAFRWLGIDRRQHRDYLWNDTGNADRLADWYGHELVYCAERTNYYAWTGLRWQLDKFVEAEKRAEKATLEAKHITDSEKEKPS